MASQPVSTEIAVRTSAIGCARDKEKEKKTLGEGLLEIIAAARADVASLAVLEIGSMLGVRN